MLRIGIGRREGILQGSCRLVEVHAVFRRFLEGPYRTSVVLVAWVE